MNEEKEPLETRVSRLGGYLTRSYNHNKPSLLFAVYLSEFHRADIEKNIRKVLHEQGLEIVEVDAGKYKNLPDYLSSINSKNTVFFVHNVEKGFPDSLQYLNFKRETIAEHQIKVVFWVTEEELTRISREAPDFFAFRNRVVEFMEVPISDGRRTELVEFAQDTEYKSLDEIKSSIELKEKLLKELSGEDEISGYLLGYLGILYDQIGSYKKAIEYYEKALGIVQEIGNRLGEGTNLGNLGLAYSDLGKVEKAIEYYEKALAIFKEIGDRRSEGIGLNNLGVAFENMKNYKDALACFLRAKDIRTDIKDPNFKTTEANIKELKEKLGEKEFENLKTDVAPKAEEIVKSLLNKK
ncbi:Photosystem I assembly protein Ycf3 [uncultured archaeon]|nr:Photosystem I assembly protein Ycf3 [uncultured archaeon]